ncbi:N-6 DNA methylase [Herbaspirillum sp. RTI4]|uniref:Eco57I restriction-modification methylase domain-containing protein n=1 Tax=Herbaspirillum sp. RTI4 TaxID=3048640 RepID=UPI002AB4925B|nr:N-6 DNA methylase [Herbaspirillum sp. RTI4]MDY7579304.1 N-6 DNA methylase [Herbaspirillum sp. RTI4]MEA9980217.1 N-6 DNA methylase [Herbaspirillum sp. RTI4]
MRQALDKLLRSALESTVIKAREVAEQAVREAIERLGVAEPQVPTYLDDSEKQLRVKLRAHARQLGDLKHDNGEQDIALLIAEAAYEHWHRMLFARFLEQNQLLMFDAHTSVTLDECAELAEGEGFSSGWAYASHLASKMLPQVFRQDSPVFQLELAINHIRDLENKIAAIDPQTFQAQDALGWVYQFWQTKRKKEVNDSGVKIGAKELSPVTQLFTEPYMVSFLLDNALGAWWANRRLSANDIATAKTEQDLRERAAIPGVPLTYLRFVEHKAEGEPAWQAAAGKFELWPQHLSELKTLDPCCGSGHFLVAAFLMLVPMRMALEGLNAKDAVDAVLCQNIHGLELDQRCVELAAFALALEAWRFPHAGGYRALPELHLACSGLSVKAAKAEWKALGIQLEDAGGKKNLAIALDWVHQTFVDAPVLGSLINPRKSNAAKIVQWDELSGALNQALTINAEGHNEEQHEAGIVAQGLAKAATLLATEYSWVITNVPYLARGKQDEVLKNFCEVHYPEAKNDLATVFLDRCLELCHRGGTASIVVPQNWLFLTSYQKFRKKLLRQETWNLLARLGAGAFETISGEVVKAILISISCGQKFEQSLSLHGGTTLAADHYLHGMDVSEQRNAGEKATRLVVTKIKTVVQSKQLENPDSRISLDPNVGENLVGAFADTATGLQTFDRPRFMQLHWEIYGFNNGWEKCQSTVENTRATGGCEYRVLWEGGAGSLFQMMEDKKNIEGYTSAIWKAGSQYWGQKGILVSLMGNLPVSLYVGQPYDQNVGLLKPKTQEDLLALWAYCSSDEFSINVRTVDQALKVTNATLGKINFEKKKWLIEAQDQYPNGLPKPYSNDPTQWIFHGHPCGSVIWHEQDKVTDIGEIRKDESVMQVALVRLLGYQWPAELDPAMELADEQRQWVNACAALASLVDDDGITCIPAVRGEKPAADCLEAMLQGAYGEAWNIHVQNELLKGVGASSLEVWLRDMFFDQHCKMFGHRPFVWQVWDGLKDGFSALINYHKLTADNLDRLIYTYLGDWIRTQEQGVKSGADGADIRLVAALSLKVELEAIKHGEAATDGNSGYDIFVRWKPLNEQAIGWNPDLNDGVRLNIRPFMSAKDMAKKGAGILRGKPNVDWKKDRGTDVASAPWYKLGEQYGESLGSRINDHHLTRTEKQVAREKHVAKMLNQASIEQIPGQQGQETSQTTKQAYLDLIVK